MTRASLQPGTNAQAELVVGPDDLASSLALMPGDDFPPVLATSRMVALMEIAAARLLQPLLEPGEMSVGVTVDITHSAATPEGETAHAKASFTGFDGKLYAFEVSAHDGSGEIGRGTHRRAIVRTARLMTGARKRSARALNAINLIATRARIYWARGRFDAKNACFSLLLRSAMRI